MVHQVMSADVNTSTMTMSDESDESDESSTSSDEGTLLVGPRASWSATPLASALCIVHCSVECIFSSPPLGVHTGCSVSTWSAIDFEQCAISNVTQRKIQGGTLDSHRATTLTIEGKKRESSPSFKQNNLVRHLRGSFKMRKLEIKRLFNCTFGSGWPHQN